MTYYVLQVQKPAPPLSLFSPMSKIGAEEISKNSYDDLSAGLVPTDQDLDD